MSWLVDRFWAARMTVRWAAGLAVDYFDANPRFLYRCEHCNRRTSSRAMRDLTTGRVHPACCGRCSVLGDRWRPRDATPADADIPTFTSHQPPSP